MMLRCLFLCLPALLGAQTIQLAPPRISSEHVFFLGKTSVTLDFDLDGAVIHYAQDAIPDAHSPVYHKPIRLTQSGSVKAVATHPDFTTSPVAERRFIRAKVQPKTMTLSTRPNENYPGKGVLSLYDLAKGSGDLHDGNWLGFQQDSVFIEADFKKKTHCNKLLFSTLSDLNAWVMPMRAVVIWGMDRAGKWQNIGSWQAPAKDAPGSNLVKGNVFIEVPLLAMTTNKIRIQMLPFGPLPAGHAGAGTPAWLFLDEIVFQ